MSFCMIVRRRGKQDILYDYLETVMVYAKLQLVKIVMIGKISLQLSIPQISGSWEASVEPELPYY